MSRLWDTPAYWARGEADEMLREMSNVAPEAVADSFERSAANYDGEPEMAVAIIAELGRRAAAGTAFGPARTCSTQRRQRRRHSTRTGLLSRSSERLPIDR